MRFFKFLAIAASFCPALAQDVVQCAKSGNRYSGPALLITQQPSFTNTAQCGALCKSQALCRTYALEAGYCRLYVQPVMNLFTKNGNGNNTFYDKACATNTDMCQVSGSRSLSPAFVTSSKITDNNFLGCQTLCTKTAGCQSYSIEIATGGSCRLYQNALVKDFTPDSSKTILFWDIKCPRTIVSSGPTFVPYQPTTTIPKIETEAAVVFPEFTPPTALSTDSPPYIPAGPQVAPDDDDDFISTYTYEEFPLPTVKAMGSPPNTIGLSQPTAIPTAPCMIQPGPEAKFSVLNENFVPMVSRASNSIGPILQPTKAPAAGDPLLNPETLDLPGFYFQQPAGASGVYDLVYAGSTTQYVAMNTAGQVLLTGASTGTAFKNGLVTTIFKVDCLGVISVTQGGSGYTWSTTGADSKLTKAATPAKNMKALPKVIPSIQSARKHRKRNQELAERLIKRSYSDGPAPKCPAQPPALVARTKQGFELGKGNLCEGLKDYWSLSPFSFDGSCLVQSLCYDQCADFGWQSCNGIFGTLAILSCAKLFESWWEIIPALACVGQASYFTAEAATSKGRELFYAAQGSMCRCFCSSPPDTCVYPNDSFYCADLRGGDDVNCGACGRQCGANSKCRKGECGCPKDQCGSLCLDFRNNPKNCGKCGLVCSSGYCLDGRCYTPVPGACLPDQSVTNNNFESYYPTFTNWTMAAYPGAGCTLGDNIKFAATNYLFNGQSNPALFIAMSDLPGQGCEAAVVQAKVKMCPSIKYELTFALGYVNKVGDSVVTSNADCTVRWLTGTPGSWTGNDGFQSSPSYSIGASNPTYKTYGPWSLHVSEGETGVTKVKKSLYVSLTAVMHCAGPVGGAGRFILRDVQMNPVGSVKARSLTAREMEEARTTVVLGPRAVNMTEELEPYHPSITRLDVSLDKANVTKRE